MLLSEKQLENKEQLYIPLVVVSLYQRQNLSPVEFPCSWLYICCHPLFLCLGDIDIGHAKPKRLGSVIPPFFTPFISRLWHVMTHLLAIS